MREAIGWHGAVSDTASIYHRDCVVYENCIPSDRIVEALLLFIDLIVVSV